MFNDNWLFYYYYLEHWAAAPRLGLDAQGSDYIYKFHVTRLQDIYSGQSIDPSIRERPPAELPNMSPVTQLYGANGDCLFTSTCVVVLFF